MIKNKARLAQKEIQSDSIVDGEGVRSVIWFQGCGHNCPFCHNPETHDFKAGYEVSINKLKKEIAKLEFQNGVTFSGGDPFYQIDALTELTKCVHDNNMNVWCYTGFTFEELIKMSKENPKYLEALNNIDVLVDGKFINELKSFDIAFRGSKNQRILDVKKSLEQNKPVIIKKYK